MKLKEIRSYHHLAHNKTILFFTFIHIFYTRKKIYGIICNCFGSHYFIFILLDSLIPLELKYLVHMITTIEPSFIIQYTIELHSIRIGPYICFQHQDNKSNNIFNSFQNKVTKERKINRVKMQTISKNYKRNLEEKLSRVPFISQSCIRRLIDFFVIYNKYNKNNQRIINAMILYFCALVLY